MNDFAQTVKDAAQKAYKALEAIPRDEDGNPLTLEDTIRSMILKNPDMMQWRDDALNVLYCVLGAGIEWNEDGRVGDNTPNNYINTPTDSHSILSWPPFGKEDSLDQMEIEKEIRARFQAEDEARIQKAIDTINQIDDRCKLYRHDRQNWYPVSWYACRLCTPENAQPDFLEGAIETCQIILKFDIEDIVISDGMRRFSGIQRTMQYAKEILPMLLKARKRR